MSNGEFVALVVFATIGLIAVLTGISWLGATCFRIIRDLAATLKEAVEIAKIYRKDINAFHEMMQPPEISPEEPEVNAGKTPTPMPSPVWGGFATREPEPEAANELPDEVDVTPTEEELLQKEEADRLLEMSGRVHPPPNSGQEP